MIAWRISQASWQTQSLTASTPPFHSNPSSQLDMCLRRPALSRGSIRKNAPLAEERDWEESSRGASTGWSLLKRLRGQLRSRCTVRCTLATSSGLAAWRALRVYWRGEEARLMKSNMILWAVEQQRAEAAATPLEKKVTVSGWRQLLLLGGSRSVNINCWWIKWIGNDHVTHFSFYYLSDKIT